MEITNFTAGNGKRLFEGTIKIKNMKNIELKFLPSREEKPRKKGIAMVMDKGLTCRDAEGLVETAGHLVDFIKLGFGTSVFTDNLKKKVDIYHAAGIKVYLGGTLLEACYIRGQIADYERLADSLGVKAIEVSDGSMIMSHEEKCDLIKHFSQGRQVLSEVGSKVAGKEIPTAEWVRMMSRELEAGSSYVIAEAREAGNTGIYAKDGSVNEDMIKEIAATVPLDSIMWEAPQKAQQVWFIKNFGAEVNLGNIPSTEIIALETIRMGLRGDTFGTYLPEELKAKVQK